MTVYDIIKMNRSNMEVLSQYDINVKDAQYVDLYEDYKQMVRNPQLKVTYIVAVLAERYHVSERQVWRIVGKFGVKIPE